MRYYCKRDTNATSRQKYFSSWNAFCLSVQKSNLIIWVYRVCVLERKANTLAWCEIWNLHMQLSFQYFIYKKIYINFFKTDIFCDIRPSMVTHTRNLCSAINPSKVRTQQWAHTHTHTHTHTPWTNTRSSGQSFMLRCPWSSWGFGALLKGTSVVVLRVERVLYIHFPQLQFLPDPRLELATELGLRVRLSNH